MNGRAPLELLHVADLKVHVAPAIDISSSRRMIAIIAGEVRGPRLCGVVPPGGADFQVIREDGVIELIARYVIGTDSRALIYVENSVLGHGPANPMERLRRCERVDPNPIFLAQRFDLKRAPQNIYG